MPTHNTGNPAHMPMEAGCGRLICFENFGSSANDEPNFLLLPTKRGSRTANITWHCLVLDNPIMDENDKP
jgi:hypothetical protein